MPFHPRALRTKSGYKLVARRDTLDFRDQMYVPSLVEVPPERPLARYARCRIPVLNQGNEGACTGFGLATVANFLLFTRAVEPLRQPVSAWMLYDLARRYDEWPGEDYDGSSARGAMKGWHKHGVCIESRWPKAGPAAAAVPARGKAGKRARAGTNNAPDPWTDALQRPLGAYFRVNHKDLVAMHAAIAEVGVLYATADVHAGWDEVRGNGMIEKHDTVLGGHAFAIVAYDRTGFWIQNSWGTKWGKGGFGHVTYDDWLANGTDVWVARLGAPVSYQDAESTAAANASTARGTRASAIRDLRPHIISLGNDGVLRPGGEYGTTRDSLARLIDVEIPATIAAWTKPKLLLYAHGGLVDEQSAVQKVADYRTALQSHEVYPLAFIWKTDYWTTLKNVLQDALHRRRTEGLLDSAKDFMLDRLDDALEPLARLGTGKLEWSEMKENARLATEAPQGGARLLLDGLARLLQRFPTLEIHVAAHSAGSILMGPLIRRLTGPVATGGMGRRVTTCSLWAPACTMDVFEECYLPAVQAGGVQEFALYTLTDRAEQDDNCGGIYHKSLLYLVSNAFEKKAHLPMFRDGYPLLGMEKFVAKSAALDALFSAGRAQWIRSPNTEPEGAPGAAAATHHGDFDDDRPTLLGTLNRITGVRIPPDALAVGATSASRRELRVTLDGRATGV